MIEDANPAEADTLENRLTAWYAATPDAPPGGMQRLRHRLAQSRRRRPLMAWGAAAAAGLLLAVGLAAGMGLQSARGSGRLHTFIIDAPRASRVSLVGDFNGWDRAAAPMRLDRGNGVWRLALRLGPGPHTYAFVVDGTEWIVDPIAPQAIDRDLGTTNLLLAEGPR